jgi:hypothetical protein
MFTLPFNHQENITTFIKCCQMLGLQATELFETPDLYNAADMMRVQFFSRFTVSPVLAPELTVRVVFVKQVLQCLDRLMQVHEKYDQETLLARIAEYKSSNVSSPLPVTRVASSTAVRPWQVRPLSRPFSQSHFPGGSHSWPRAEEAGRSPSASASSSSSAGATAAGRSACAHLS